jgi:hemolysin activation/secretion protein
MSERSLDVNPCESRRRHGRKKCGRQPGSSSPPDGFVCRASHWQLPALIRAARRGARFGLLALGCAAALVTSLPAAEPAAVRKATNSVAIARASAGAGTNAAPRFDVKAFVVKCDRLIFTNTPTSMLSEFTGTNVGLERIVRAASTVLSEFQRNGYARANISIAQEMITNGVVTMHVYQGAFPQVLISGRPFLAGHGAEEGAILAAAGPPATNSPPAVQTNAEPRLTVIAYEIHGDTLLSENTLMSIFAKRTGTNVALSDIKQAASDLQMEYRSRGYPTVLVTIPPQTITNGMVKIRVFQGRLSEILVTQNRYFSSNNVVRALPSLHTNTILVGPVFQAELDRANRNQDRQISGQLEPGLEENTTILNLQVKDRLPLHAKVDFNNQSSPGTPELRINTSASYQNLWQLEHSIGVQYSFSPQSYKSGDSWNWYDLPAVANYGGFYRLPLGVGGPVEGQIAKQGGSFGYDEATRQFRLPAASGQPELNLYASRSTIDTGVTAVYSKNLFNTNGNSLDRNDVQQGITINSAFGSRLSLPLNTSAQFQSGFSTGFDYKQYQQSNYKTNIFTLASEILDTISNPGHVITNINVSTVRSPVPGTVQSLDYLPLALRYNASLRDAWGVTAFGLGLSADAWYSGSRSNLDLVTGSSESSGHWVILSPTISRDFLIQTNWVLTLHGEGQWATEPLISNEQYGLGGVNTVRGYQEGAVLGDTGWWIGFEQKTPPQVIGSVYRNHRLSVRGAVFMEYGQAYLLGPNRHLTDNALWGTGFGGVFSLGNTWEARLLFSWPLLTAGTSQADQPRFDFSLSAQF